MLVNISDISCSVTINNTSNICVDELVEYTRLFDLGLIVSFYIIYKDRLITYHESECLIFAAISTMKKVCSG